MALNEAADDPECLGEIPTYYGVDVMLAIMPNTSTA